MTRYILTLLLAISFLISCDSKRSYKYVEVVEEESILGGTDTKEKDAKAIKSSNDSAAYLQAYQNFCISVKVNRDMKQSLGKVYSTPIKFKLYNDKGIDITNSIIFSDKEKKEKEVADRIFLIENTIQDDVSKNKEKEIRSFQSTTSINSVKVKGFEKYFRKSKDEFSNSNKVWYKPKSAPQYTNRNGIYCYFQTENGIPSNLRFRLQYYADDWLFFSRVQFSIDNKAYDYIPLDTERDSGDGGYIWEWFDESLSQSDTELITTLANAKSAKMKLIGRQYYDIKTISQEQINSIKRTLDLYQAMGGQY